MNNYRKQLAFNLMRSTVANEEKKKTCFPEPMTMHELEANIKNKTFLISDDKYSIISINKLKTQIGMLNG